MAANGRYSMGAGQKDTRPVNEKGYKEYAIKKIINYLIEHNFDMTVTPKLLAQPTQKLFVSIMLFLFRQLDPQFSWSDQGYEEDVPRIFKLLKYPHSINKSALKSLSSSVTWPSVLAAVEFLINLLVFDEMTHGDEDEGLGVEQEEHEKLFFQYLGQAYEKFLDGENEFEALEKQLAVHFAEQNGQIEADISMLQQASAEAQNQLTKLQEEGDRIAQTQQVLDDLEADVVKFSKVKNDWIKYKADLEAQTASYKEALVEHERALELAELEKKEVQERLDQQELKLEDVERMHREREDLDEKLLSLAEHRDRAQAQLDDTMAKFRKKAQELEEKAAQYAAVAAQLKIVPVGAKHANGKDMDLRLDLDASTGKAMVNGLDLKGLVKPALMKLKFTFQQRSKDTHSVSVDLKQELDAQEESNTELEKEIAQMQAELDRQEAQYKTEKTELDSELGLLHQQTVDIQEETARLEQASQAELTKSIRGLEESSAHLEEVKRTIQQETEGFQNDLTQALMVIMNHKTLVKTQLHKLAAEVQAHAEAIAANDPLSLLD